MGRFSVALKIRGDTDWGTAQAESQCRPARIEPIRPILSDPDCQGALAGMGVKRDKEEKVMCHDAAGTDTRILKKQVCPSRDEQDERADRWAGEPTKSLPAIPGARCRLYYPWFDFDPVSFVRRGGARRRRREGTRTTRSIDNEGIKANCFYFQNTPQKTKMFIRNELH